MAAGWLGGRWDAAGWGVLGGEGRTSCLLCSCVLLLFAMCSISIAKKKSSPRALDVKKIDQGLSVTGGAENCPGKSNMRRYLFQTYHIVQNS